MNHKTLVIAFALAASVLATYPSHASCSGASVLSTDAGAGISWIFTPEFQDDPSFYYYMNMNSIPVTYTQPGLPPLSADARASFWRIGSGDPALGVGDDNGSYDLIASGGVYLHYSYSSIGFYSGAKLLGSWSDSKVDGCIGTNQCQALLLNDQSGGESFFAIATAQSSGTGDTFFDQGNCNQGNNLCAPIVLMPIQPPGISSAGGLLTISTQALTGPADGLYYKDGCNSAVVGYHVYAQFVPIGGMPPVDRSRGDWLRMTSTPTVFGDEVSIPEPCSAVDLYLAISIVLDSGFETPYVSQSGARVHNFTVGPDADMDGYCDTDECAPNDPNIHPGAPEICNSVDDNCNGLIDEDLLGEDSDGDGFPNQCDNCPLVVNSSQLDTDGDSIGNSCDNCLVTANPSQTDADLDTLGDACDNCPTAANLDQTDGDSDSIGDACDNCPAISNTSQANIDGDSVGDACDSCSDTDGDGFGNPGFDNSCATDNCPTVSNSNQADADADSVGDACDNCALVLNPGQLNQDADSLGDICDNCPLVSNPSQSDLDVDSVGDACDTCTDTDGDGFGNPWFPPNTCAQDNCPDLPNPTQIDPDLDGVGTLCDNCIDVANPFQEDADADGLGDHCDNCILVSNIGQQDSDMDTVGDSCDNCISTLNTNQSDFDADAHGDACDNCPLDSNFSQGDSDQDRVGDACDNCLSFPNQAQSDVDADNEGDLCDIDDGLITSLFVGPTTLQWDMESGFTLWNAYRGRLSVLTTSPGSYSQLPGSNPSAAQMCRLSVTMWTDTDRPASGEVAYYLTTGVDALGGESDLGQDSGGMVRPNGNACP